MKTVRSRFKLFGTLGIYLLHFGLTVFVLVLHLVSNNGFFKELPSGTLNPVIWVAPILLALFLGLLMRFCKRIQIDQEGIRFTNPVLPFIHRKYAWSDVEGYLTVDEPVQNRSSVRAVWLVTEGKVKHRITALTYANLPELEAALPLPYGGHFACSWGESVEAKLGIRDASWVVFEPKGD